MRRAVVVEAAVAEVARKVAVKKAAKMVATTNKLHLGEENETDRIGQIYRVAQVVHVGVSHVVAFTILHACNGRTS
jgi:phosphoribosylformylglycinamidine (FGAM) synthase-like enzyme